MKTMTSPRPLLVPAASDLIPAALDWLGYAALFVPDWLRCWDSRGQQPAGRCIALANRKSERGLALLSIRSTAVVADAENAALAGDPEATVGAGETAA